LKEKSVRVQRVEKEIQHVIALYLQHEVAERMPASAAVTAVDVTSDLRKAAVYFRMIGTPTEAAESEKILLGHRKAAQKRVADLRLKFCPVLEFRFGQAKAEEDEVDRLLAELSNRKNHWSE
jgi:ribosome-binding factor A